MYEVRMKSNNAVLYKNESYELSKKFAERAAKNFGEPFDVYKVEQVWTTQTLDEAIDDGSYTGDPRLATPMRRD